MIAARHFIVLFASLTFTTLGVMSDCKSWRDDFNGGNLPDRWNFDLGTGPNADGWGNQELQCYTNKEGNVRQENGRLIIQVKKEQDSAGGRSCSFTSARLKSKASWKYGKVTMSARLPKGKHIWPAFWMLPLENKFGEWPRSGEIDIMEFRGQKPQENTGTAHYGKAWNEKTESTSGAKNFGHDFSKDFHVFGLEWNSSEMKWSVDGQVYHTMSLNRNLWPGLYNRNGDPFNEKFFVLVNMAVGGNFFGNEQFNPDESNKWEKSTFEIDWINVESCN